MYFIYSCLQNACSKNYMYISNCCDKCFQCLQNSLKYIEHYMLIVMIELVIIMKTHLFKYIEQFTSKN